MRGLLDGHTWLSRKIATRGHYPAIDVLESISRLMNDIVPEKQRADAMLVRQLLSAYREHEDLISIGAYRRGSNRYVDTAMDMLDDINGFLQQEINESSTIEGAGSELAKLSALCRARLDTPTPAPAAAIPVNPA